MTNEPAAAASETSCCIMVAKKQHFLNSSHKKNGVLVVRSLSDGAKRKSTFLIAATDHYFDGGGPVEELAGSFKSLTLSTALKSLSDSKLDCCSGEKKIGRRLNQFGQNDHLDHSSFIKIHPGSNSMQDTTAISQMLLSSQENQNLDVEVSNDDFETDFYPGDLKRPSTKSRGSMGSSASLELDSGRASDTGTLGQSSTTSGCSSTSSTSDGVRIVSHSFCDFVGGAIKKKTRCLEEDSSFCSLSPTSTGGSSGGSSASSYYYYGERPSLVLFDAEAVRSNKVSVFVPYSTLLRGKKEVNRTERETSVDGDEENEREIGKEDNNDNVFICGDTQVILRINSAQDSTTTATTSSHNRIRPRAYSSTGDEIEESLVKNSKIYSKRMTKKLSAAIPVLQDSNERPEVNSQMRGTNSSSRGRQHRLPRPPPISPKIVVRTCQSVTPTSSMEDLSQNKTVRSVSENRSEKSTAQIPPAPQVRRKDLCKLLGLNNESDLNNSPERRNAQKVALLHTAKLTTDEPRQEVVTKDTEQAKRRKNLAKFLGVDSVEARQTSAERQSSTERKLFSRESLSRSISSAGDGSMSSKGNRGRSKRLLPSYWGHLVRSWRDGNGGSTGGDDRDGCDDIEMEVPVQLLQLPSNEGERTNRKDLSKFLGLDDSDGEEIIFIQTRPPQNRNRPEPNPDFENRGLAKSRSFSSSSLRLTNSEGHNTIDEFLRSSICRNKGNIPEWLGSLGKASLKRVLKTAEERNSEDSQSDDFDPPPRKSVLFKEYAFSVQESIATGLPIIPFVGPTLPPSGERKRKKEAAKRTAEILSKSKIQVNNNNNSSSHNNNGTSLEALLRIANEEWMRENEEESSSSVLDTSHDTSEHSSASVASTVKKGLNTNLVTLDRKQQAPSRMAVHPKVMEASKTLSSNGSTISASNNNNSSSSESANKGVQRGSVVFGPTSHRWIPRRNNARESYVEMYAHPQMAYPQPFICRPAQFYAAMPIPHQQQQAFYPPFQPRMAMYPDSGRVKLVRRNPARQIIQSGDYVDMRQAKVLKGLSDEDQ